MSRYSRDRSRSEDRYREARRRPNEPIPKLYAGNIDASIPEEEVQKELRNMCEKYGEISEITVKSRAGSDHTYAFVQFKVYEDAEKAVQNLRGCTFRGKEIKIELGRGGRKELAPRNTEGCYICGRDGHFARDCEQRGRGRDYDRHERRRSSSRDRDRDRRRRSRSRSRSRSSDHYRRGDRERRRYSRSRSDERRRDDRRRASRSRSRSPRDYRKN